MDPDLLVGTGTPFKLTTAGGIEARIKQKHFSLQQAQQKIVYQMPSPESPTRPTFDVTPPTKPLSALDNAFNLSAVASAFSQNDPHGVTSGDLGKQLFYYNNNCNFELRTFLSDKVKQTSSEHKDRPISTAHPSSRPSPGTRGKHGSLANIDPMNCTARQPTEATSRNEDLANSFTFEKSTLESPELQKSLVLIQNPNFGSHLPKGWNLNHGEDTRTGQGDEEKNSRMTATIDAGGTNRKAHISKRSNREKFADVAMMMKHTLAAKQKIQEKLNEDLFAKSGERGFNLFQPRANAHSYPRKTPDVHNTCPDGIVPRSQQGNHSFTEADAALRDRKKISTRDDAVACRNSGLSTMINFLPRRVKLNVKRMNTADADRRKQDSRAGESEESEQLLVPRLREVSRPRLHYKAAATEWTYSPYHQPPGRESKSRPSTAGKN